MQKLFFHIGTHKTGTSALQRLIFREKFKLARQDKLFVVNLHTFPGMNNLMTAEVFSHALVADLEEFFNDKLRKTQGKFFVSHEGLSGNADRLYANREIVAQMLYVASRRYQPEIIVFFRRQDEFLQSVFTQKIHEGKTFTIDEFLARSSLDNLDWNSFLKPYLTLFSPEHVHVYPYDRAILQDKTIVDLINMVVDSEVLAKVEPGDRVNVGYSLAGLEIAEELNRDLSKCQQRILRNVLQDICNKGVGQEYNILSFAQKKEIVEKFKDSNSQLAALYFKDRFGMSKFSEPVYECEENVVLDSEYQKVVKRLLVILEERENDLIKLNNTFFQRFGRKIYLPLSRIVKRTLYRLD